MPKRKSALSSADVNGVEDSSMPNTNRSVDREWFIDRIKHCKLTQRTFAQQTGLHLTSVIRLLGGKRALKLDEVPIVAEVLRTTVSEVLEHAGMDPRAARNVFVHTAGARGRLTAAEPGAFRAAIREDAGAVDIAVIGWVDGSLTVHAGRALGPSHVPLPLFLGQNPEKHLAGPVQALRMQTTSSPYSGLDGAIVYFVMSDGAVPLVAPETLCIVEFEDGTRKLRVVHRGYEQGRFNLSDFSGVRKESEVKIKSLYSVVHILFGGIA